MLTFPFELTKEQIEKAHAMVPEIKNYLARFPMHQTVLCLQIALFVVNKTEFLQRQIENLRNEL